MLIIAIALIGALAIAGLIAFTVLCLGIRREDKAASLDRQAPGFAALQARRFTGWREANQEPALQADVPLTPSQGGNR